MKRKSQDKNESQRSTAERQHQRAENATTDRGHPIETLHRRVGNRAVQALYERGDLQTKLDMSSPNDPAEREAERVAEAVVRSEYSDEGDATVEGPDIQRSAASGVHGGTLTGEAESQVQSSLGSGRPLPESTRSSFESRFGRDLSNVRVHTGPDADEAARSINAEAFTVGADVAFAGGNYDPNTTTGEKLLAHELTHVAQQGSAPSVRPTVDRMATEGRAGGGTVMRTPDEDELVFSERVSSEFTQKVREISSELGIGPNHLMAVMSHETGGTFDPAIESDRSTATGLIQFTGVAREDLGVTQEELKEMSGVEQLDYVRDYFKKQYGYFGYDGSDLTTVEDVYLVVFAPAIAGKNDDEPVYSSPSEAYENHKHLDANGDGTIYKSDVKRNVLDRLGSHAAEVTGERAGESTSDSGGSGSESGSSTSGESASTGNMYVVQPGDTFSGITSEVDEVDNWRTLYNANADRLGLESPRDLGVGDTLVIPGREGSSGPETGGMSVPGTGGTSQETGSTGGMSVPGTDGTGGMSVPGSTGARGTEQSTSAVPEWLRSAGSAVQEQVESTADTAVQGVSLAAEQLRSWVGEPATEPGAEAEAKAEEDRAVSDVMQDVIERETEAYQNLTVTVEGEQITVEPQYFMNSDLRRRIHDRDSTGFEDVSLDGDADEQFMGVGGETESGTYRAVDYSKTRAVGLGKASPDVLEEFIQEAIDSGVITNSAEIDAPLSENSQQKVQTWIDQAGVGVDCSGLVAHMITEIRGEALAEEDSIEEDIEVPDDPVAAGDQSGEARIMNKRAGLFNNPITSPEDLRPGDVHVTPSHVKMVASKEETDDGWEVTIVESTGTRDDESGWGNDLEDGRMRGGIQVTTETFSEGEELTNFHRPDTLELIE